VGKEGGLGKLLIFFWGVRVMSQGTIKKLVVDRGFGFIAGERGDVFFHHSALEETSIEDLSEGQVVEFEDEPGPKGPRATSVKVV